MQCGQSSVAVDGEREVAAGSDAAEEVAAEAGAEEIGENAEVQMVQPSAKAKGQKNGKRRKAASASVNVAEELEAVEVVAEKVLAGDKEVLLC